MMPRMMPPRPRPPVPRHPGPMGPPHRGPPPRGIPPPMAPTFTPPAAPQVGSVTNDPSTAKSRVFVGNLNTIALTKEDVEEIFSRYGHVTGLSMHKGYAFIQYANVLDARRACGAEDGMTYAGQALDINIASEPKHRPGSAQKATTAQNSGTTTRVVNTQSGPPMKKQRTDSGAGGMKRTLVNLTSGSSSTPASKTITQLTQAAKDVLICGVCKTSFSSLHSLAQHKKTPCRLKISCQCQSTPPPESPEPAHLVCASCNAEFSSSWDLCQHCQQEHSLSIYKVDEEITEVKEEVVLFDGDKEVNGNGQ